MINLTEILNDLSDCAEDAGYIFDLGELEEGGYSWDNRGEKESEIMNDFARIGYDGEKLLELSRQLEAMAILVERFNSLR